MSRKHINGNQSRQPGKSKSIDSNLQNNIKQAREEAEKVRIEHGISEPEITASGDLSTEHTADEANRMFKSALETKKIYEKAKDSLSSKEDSLLKREENVRAKESDITAQENSLKEKVKKYEDDASDLLDKQIDWGKKETTGIIACILGKVEESQKEIEIKREEVKTLLTNSHEEILNDINALLGKNKELDKREIDIKRREIEVAINTDDLAFREEEFQEDYKEQVRKDIESDKLQIKKLQFQLNELQHNYEVVNGELSAIYSEFGRIEPAATLEKFKTIKEKLAKAEDELNHRITKEEENALRANCETLLKERDVTKTLELKSKTYDFDRQEAEIRGLNDQLEIYKNEANSLSKFLEETNNRHKKDIAGIEENYKKSISATEATLNRLLEDRDKHNCAFQFVYTCEKNDSLHKGSPLEENPSSLRDLVDYLQHKLASKWTHETKRDELRYTKETIRTFIAGLNMSPLSILQGISGTGKTSLPRDVAKALFCGDETYHNDDAPFKRIAIQSGWRDNMDLMGNYNSFESKYNETDFFKALYIANQPKYSNTLFLIILDEMNLSRPEYYFADFLSLIEESEGNRKIYLQNVPETVIPSSPTCSIKRDSNGSSYIEVPRNVRFIGTANHDETTAEFAPKTYDRSNVMDMPENPPTDIDSTAREMCMSYVWLEQQFKIAKSKYGQYTTKFFEFLKVIKPALAKVGIGVGNRFDKQANLFISAYLASGNNIESDLAYAADFLIKSRLFRTLKNNYDITESEFKKFRENYVKDFSNAFSEPPYLGDELLDDVYKKNFKKDAGE